MKILSSFVMLCALIAAAVPAGAASFGTTAPVVHGFAIAPDASNSNAAIGYCEKTGGAYELRRPEYGTNNNNPLVLTGWAGFCNYTSGKGMRQTHIWILVSTLYATTPTLAVLAYEAKVPFNSKTCPGGANPASCYCTQLGGSDQFGGATLGGGAWVLPSGGTYADLETCVMPDFSAIDSFGLLYHSDGTIRGIDLNKVTRYHEPGK